MSKLSISIKRTPSKNHAKSPPPYLPQINYVRESERAFNASLEVPTKIVKILSKASPIKNYSHSTTSNIEVLGSSLQLRRRFFTPEPITKPSHIAKLPKIRLFH